jgi:cell wall-associated NlpC family hydrolase
MRLALKSASAALVCVATLTIASAQAPSIDRSAKSAKPAPVRPKRPVKRTLTKEDRSSVIDVALHSKAVRRDGRDCSHLVHAIYQRAGFPYKYADSEDLYTGVKGFLRVSRPQPADLVVWHGHVGIVTHPTQHAFFSFLSTGPQVDDYSNRYWRGRGQPRFYRYVKNDPCPGCTLARGNGE